MEKFVKVGIIKLKNGLEKQTFMDNVRNCGYEFVLEEEDFDGNTYDIITEKREDECPFE